MYHLSSRTGNPRTRSLHVGHSENCKGQCVPCVFPGFWCFVHKLFFPFSFFRPRVSLYSKAVLELILGPQPPSAGITRVCHYTQRFHILTLIPYSIFVFIFMWHSPTVHTCLYIQMSPFYKDTGILNWMLLYDFGSIWLPAKEGVSKYDHICVGSGVG